MNSHEAAWGRHINFILVNCSSMTCSIGLFVMRKEPPDIVFYILSLYITSLERTASSYFAECSCDEAK